MTDSEHEKGKCLFWKLTVSTFSILKYPKLLFSVVIKTKETKSSEYVKGTEKGQKKIKTDLKSGHSYINNSSYVCQKQHN